MKSISNSYYLIPNKDNFSEALSNLQKFYNENNNIEVLSHSSENIHFSYIYKNKIYNGEYSIIRKRDDLYYYKLNFQYDRDKKKTSSAMSAFIRSFEAYKKDSFYLVSLYDELSEYLCNLSYKYIAEYERKLRQLFLVIVVPLYGDKWADETPKVSNIKANMRTKIEKGLSEIELSDLQSLFFGEVFNLDENNYDIIFDTENIYNQSSDQLRNNILKNKPYTFWNKHISKYLPNVDVESKVKKVKDIRNTIAHSKFLTYQKYLELIKDLKYIIRNINQVIEVEMSEKDELSAEVMIQDLSLIARKLPSMEAISKIIPDISKLVPSILEINKIMTPTIEVIRKTVIPTFEVTRKLVEPYNEYMKHVNFDNNFNIPDKYLEDETRPTDNLTGDDDDDNLKDNE
ncbi:hypothetical protein EGW76_04275 [Enterococcus gallinarum]|jgi:hypothetical protein|uniref:hypothetical protein n=1 Tax=Enterococcus gallinarum TaxID=1353 RepID=UPI000F505641|nr:hypothetical protein [Enterococcus gallinarum]ROY90661.1 hypothetical protein EGW76_04275 [Enterococcus gallinarum]DAM66184.1 MAG TPA: Swt1-like HEPN [Caudoviricetes sp.]